MAIDPTRAWDAFGIFESATTVPAGRLVDHAAVAAGEVGLDVGCGTGVVAITAARRGAKMSGVDPSSALLQRAKESAALAEVTVDWHEGGAEYMPFPDETFDVVLSQFGHMFSPNPIASTDEMLRVLRPAGRYVVSVWDGDHFIGRLWKLLAKRGLTGFEAPILWGDTAERQSLLSHRLSEYTESSGVLVAPSLSPAHTFQTMGRAIAPLAILIDQLSEDPPVLASFRREVMDLIASCAESNAIPQRYTILSGKKR